MLHLLPENGLFSADQPLPGLLPQRHQGGEFDAASLHQPTLQTAFALSVSAVALSYPMALEARLLRQLHDEASAASGGGGGGGGGGVGGGGGGGGFSVVAGSSGSVKLWWVVGIFTPRAWLPRGEAGRLVFLR